jgi:hypothetical protein
LNEKWIKKLIKYNQLTDMAEKCLVRIEADGYETEVKADFIAILSLGALHPGTSKFFGEITSLKGRNMDRQGVDL